MTTFIVDGSISVSAIYAIDPYAGIIARDNNLMITIRTELADAFEVWFRKTLVDSTILERIDVPVTT